MGEFKIVVLDFCNSEVNIYNLNNDSYQIEDIETFLINKGYRLKDIEYIYGEYININFFGVEE